MSGGFPPLGDQGGFFPPPLPPKMAKQPMDYIKPPPRNTGFNIVPQGEMWVAERLGKYHATLEPGLVLLIPFVDAISYRHSSKEQAHEIPNQNAITQDNVVVHIDGILFMKVVDAKKASYSMSRGKGSELKEDFFNCKLMTTHLRACHATPGIRRYSVALWRVFGRWLWGEGSNLYFTNVFFFSGEVVASSSVRGAVLLSFSVFLGVKKIQKKSAKTNCVYTFRDAKGFCPTLSTDPRYPPKGGYSGNC